MIQPFIILSATSILMLSPANARAANDAEKNMATLSQTAQIADQIRPAVEPMSTEKFEQSYFDHSAWDALLKKHVAPIPGSSAVDYDGFKTDRATLANYLNALAQISQDDFDTWPLDHQLAFLINAYNAGTIELILTRYPDIESIRQISSPWGQKFVSLFGENISLDNIEHGLIRGDRYNEPRIHFAVNCASIGCPPLLNAAYEGDRLNAQLDASTKLFLSDTSRNYLDGKTIYVSKIFKWYRKDFEQGWGGANSLGAFLALYPKALNLDDNQIKRLNSGKIKIKTTDYDWDLNKIRN